MKEGSIIRVLPETLLSEEANSFGFISIVDHTRSRITATGYKTSIKESYKVWWYI